jgi:hypothetical protein
MELGSYFLFLQEQITDIIITVDAGRVLGYILRRVHSKMNLIHLSELRRRPVVRGSEIGVGVPRGGDYYA